MASETPDQQQHLESLQSSGREKEDGEETLSPLEQEVLDEYARLLENLNTMSSLLLTLSNAPSAAILDGLRGLERKTSLVFTLLKASVYSIVLNQQITDGSGGGDATEEEREEQDRRRRELDG